MLARALARNSDRRPLCTRQDLLLSFVPILNTPLHSKHPLQASTFHCTFNASQNNFLSFSLLLLLSLRSYTVIIFLQTCHENTASAIFRREAVNRRLKRKFRFENLGSNIFVCNFKNYKVHKILFAFVIFIHKCSR